MGIGLLDILSILLIISGVFFFLGASVGLLRFPDFYTRIHAAGKGDTLSTLLIMAGAAVYELNHFEIGHGAAIGILLVVAKIMGIGVFIMLTSPTSTHALMKAGYDDHIEPVGERDEMAIDLPPMGGAAAATLTKPAPGEQKPPAKKKEASEDKKDSPRRKKD